MTGDKVTGVYYMTRSDGVELYRFAVPNTKTGDEWDRPQFKIRQDQTGILYDEAIDVENAPYTYTETDIPAKSDIEPQPETDLTVTDTLKMLNELGVNTGDQQKATTGKRQQGQIRNQSGVTVDIRQFKSRSAEKDFEK